MPRFQVSREVAWRNPPTVRVRTVEAPDAATAIRIVAAANNLPLKLFTAREVPPLKPVGEGKLP